MMASPVVAARISLTRQSTGCARSEASAGCDSTAGALLDTVRTVSSEAGRRADARMCTPSWVSSPWRTVWVKTSRSGVEASVSYAASTSLEPIPMLRTGGLENETGSVKVTAASMVSPRP